mmetsp:Transcript_4208/g.7370  ORF Transcript_4208/g.7370 Transcript_4208/m.7370 type:complete len:391 (-) Transcript_4208:1037-2209(-)
MNSSLNSLKGNVRAAAAVRRAPRDKQGDQHARPARKEQGVAHPGRRRRRASPLLRRHQLHVGQGLHLGAEAHQGLGAVHRLVQRRRHVLHELLDLRYQLLLGSRVEAVHSLADRLHAGSGRVRRGKLLLVHHFTAGGQGADALLVGPAVLGVPHAHVLLAVALAVAALDHAAACQLLLLVHKFVEVIVPVVRPGMRTVLAQQPDPEECLIRQLRVVIHEVTQVRNHILLLLLRVDGQKVAAPLLAAALGRIELHFLRRGCQAQLPGQGVALGAAALLDHLLLLLPCPLTIGEGVGVGGREQVGELLKLHLLLVRVRSCRGLRNLRVQELTHVGKLQVAALVVPGTQVVLGGAHGHAVLVLRGQVVAVVGVPFEVGCRLVITIPVVHLFLK